MVSSAVAIRLRLGCRRGFGNVPLHPHNVVALCWLDSSTMDGPEFTAGEQSAAEWPPAPRYAFEAPTIINTVTSANLSRLPSSSTRSCQHFWRHVAWYGLIKAFLL